MRSDNITSCFLYRLFERTSYFIAITVKLFITSSVTLMMALTTTTVVTLETVRHHGVMSTVTTVAEITVTLADLVRTLYILSTLFLVLTLVVQIMLSSRN